MKSKVSEAMRQSVQRLYEKNGVVTTTMILDSAKNKRSPLHGWFEWSDTKAAHEFRLIQARQLIRRVVIKMEGREERLIHVPHITKGEGEYLAGGALVTQPDMFARALESAQTQLRASEMAVTELKRLASESTDGRAEMIVMAMSGIGIAREALAKIQ